MRNNVRLSWVLAVLLAAAAILLAGSETRDYGRAKPLVPQAQPHDLVALVEKFEGYKDDFLEMAESRKGDPEFELLMYLENIAARVDERLSADQIMISMYDQIQCPDDRARVRAYVSAHFAHESKAIDFDLASVNRTLVHSQISAVAQIGLQMKNDLRATKEKLDSIIASL